MDKKMSKKIISLIFLVYLLYGSIESMRTATLSLVIQEQNLNYATGGFIITSFFIGYTVSNIMMGFLAKKIGSSNVLFLGLCFFLLSTILYVIGSVPFLLIGAALSGVASGSVAITANHLVINADPLNRGRNLNWTSMFHSIGAMIIPIYCSFFFAKNVDWKSVYITPLPLLLIIICAAWKLFLSKKNKIPHEIQQDTNSKIKKQVNQKDHAQQIFKDRKVFLILLMVLMYICSEVGIINWLVGFLVSYKNYPIEVATRYLSAYFFLVMLGRLAGGLIIDKLGYIKSVCIMCIFAIICIVAGILTQELSGMFLAASGLFYSTIYPTGIAIISDNNKENTQQVIGIYCACGGVGGILSGYLFGGVSDMMGIDTAMWLVTVFLLGVILSVFFIPNRKKGVGELV